MLVSLRVRDLAVLEDVDVALETGLTVLTGETGAGKSLVVDALSLLSGERGDASLVRAGADRLVVEGLFESDDPAVRDALVAAGLAEEGAEASATEVAIRREVAATGKGRLWVNGSPAALRTLADLAPRLLVLYGQAEARELLDPGVPRELLDRFAGLEDAAAEVARLHAAWREREDDRRRLEGRGEGRAERLELLEFQLGEIDGIAPRPGEEEELGEEKLSLASVEKRGGLLAQAVAALESDEGGALPALTALRRTLQALVEVDPAATSRLAAVEEVLERVSDLAASTSRDLDRLEADPARLAAVAERLDALARLRRKYGPTLDDVLAHRDRIARERDELSDLAGALAKADGAARAAFGRFRTAALELSGARAAAAPRLAESVVRHLRDLAFLAASFSVDVGRKAQDGSPLAAGGTEVAFGPHGVDQVSFLFAPNPGEPARPLQRIASGGELSRVQLALSAALAEGESACGTGAGKGRGAPVRTFVFDEVDAGVSGATAEAVGRKLRTLARRGQVLVVTHLPQVAAAGDRHLSVSKEASGGRTRTTVRPLPEGGRVEAIAALLAGSSVGEAARSQARQLLASAEAAGRAGSERRGRKGAKG